MIKLDTEKLHVGKVVWYKYENVNGEPDGPFKVERFYGDYRGRTVILKRIKLHGEERNVLLAADDDFGEPIFYGKSTP